MIVVNASEFKKALDYIVEEKGIETSVVVEAMQAALSTAYKKNFGEAADIRVDVDIKTGNIKVYKVTTILDAEPEEGSEIKTFIMLDEAKKSNPKAKVGDTIEEEVTPKDFGRVAAGAAKQVVMQKIREAERENVMSEFSDKEEELMVGFLAMEDARNYYVDLGKARGILPKTEIIPGEVLKMGSSVKVYITKVESTTKGPLILVSRKHYGFIKRLFELEIPEFKDGILLMHGVAREAGIRSKVAISSTDSKIDPIGACIGEKGSRIANIIKELNGEKIDLILYDENPEQFIKNALNPAQNLIINIVDEKEHEVLAIADKENLSLAIGKKGINIKLASRLTKYRISIKTMEEINEEINEK